MIKPKIKILTENQSKNGLEISYADIFSFDFLPNNIKSHDEEGIKESIQTFGFVDPILVNQTTNRDISGNGRLKVLRGMFETNEPCPKGIIEKTYGSTHHFNNSELPPITKKWFAPVVLHELSEEDEEILAIKLNVTNEKGGIDNIKAYEVLKRLKERSEASFNLTGYTAQNLEHIQMLAKFHSQVANIKSESESKSLENNSDETENITLELNKKWQFEFGDIFQIGNHRLICGDSSKPETYQNLLKNSDGLEKIRLLFTSPPYDNQRTYEIEGNIDWTGLMNGVCHSVFPLLSAPADVIFNLGMIYDGEVKFYWNDWLDYCKNELKNPVYGLYVWDKIKGAPGQWNGRLAPCHEFFFHFSFGREDANKWIEKSDASIERGPNKTNFRMKDGGIKPINSPETLTQPFKVPDSVIRLHTELSRGIHTEGHPATFPIALPEFFLKTYSMIGDSILEPFAGSGTTFIACENLDRVAFGCEISPNYCALILERMQKTFPTLEIKKL